MSDCRSAQGKFRLALTVVALLLLGLPAAASATLTARPSTTTIVPNGTSTSLSGLSVVASDSGQTLQVALSTDIGTLAVTNTASVTLTPGNQWSGTDLIAFTGTRDNVNAALASVSITTNGISPGTKAKVSLTVLPSDANYVYSPTNGHFYRYFANSGITWDSAKTAAAGQTFRGQSGYLGTIPNAKVNAVVKDKLNAQNVWAGGKATNDSNAVPYKRIWRWETGVLAGQAFTYCTNLTAVCDFANNGGLFHDWNTDEPNNAGSETALGINYNGTGKWNDYAPNNNGVTGYIVEYGDENGAQGFSGVSSVTSSTLIDRAPNAPTSPSASRGNQQATVAFTAPTGNPGTGPTSYTVSATPGSQSATCSTSPCVLGGLANGTEYPFTVRASNPAGDSPESGSVTATHSTTAGAPSNAVATRGNRSASVAFTTPGSDGGNTISSYLVTASPGDAMARCASSPCVVPGLTNGTAYTFTVRATNVAGDSAASAASSAVTPATVPDKPFTLSATRGNSQSTLIFTAPADNGSEIDDYTVSITDDATTTTQTCTSNVCVITGLSNGTTYSLSVVANNDVGASASSDSIETTPATTPGAPTAVSASRGSQSAIVTFDVPAFDGGAPVTRYEFSTDGEQNWSEVPTTAVDSDTRRGTLAGLTNGTEYDISVRAVNAVGASDAGVAGQLTPAAVPDAPTAVSAARDDSAATVSFGTPADNGEAITAYRVRAFPGGATATCASSPCAVPGLTNGTAYTFTVVATNDVGDSTTSEPSEPTTPATAPAAPTALAAAGSDKSITLTFTAPSNGGAAITAYEYSVDDGANWLPLTTSQTGTSVSGVVSELTNDTAYSALVRAINDVGSGPHPLAGQPTPVAPPPPTPPAPTATTTVVITTPAPSTTTPTTPTPTPTTGTLLKSAKLKSSRLKPRRKTTLKVVLTKSATVTFTAKSTKRTKQRVGKFTRKLKAGTSNVTIRRQFGKGFLKPGLYKVTVRAKQGKATSTKVLYLRVVRR